MNKTRFGLHLIFALLGLGVSLLFFGIGGQFIVESQHNTYHDPSEGGWAAAFCGGGLLCLIFSLALIMRLNWARIAFQVLLLLGGISWMIFIVVTGAQNPRAWAVLGGMAGFGLLTVVFGVLLLENVHFEQDLKNGRIEPEEKWDILDQ